MLCMSPEQVLVLLLGAEPPVLCTRQKHSRPYSEVTLMTLLTTMADKELVHMIAWAKKLPGESFAIFPLGASCNNLPFLSL